MNNRRIIELCDTGKAEIIFRATDRNVPRGLRFEDEETQGPNRVEQYWLEQLPKTNQINIIYCDGVPMPREIEIIAPEEFLGQAQRLIEEIFGIKFSPDEIIIR